MRNDIDDILNSMFRGGKFRLGDKREDPEKKGPSSQEPDPMDLGAALEAARQRQEQAGQAVAAAQEAGDRDGSRSRNRRSASGGTWARVPPLTGSMTMTGLLCLRATS